MAAAGPPNNQENKPNPDNDDDEKKEAYNLPVTLLSIQIDKEKLPSIRERFTEQAPDLVLNEAQACEDILKLYVLWISDRLYEIYIGEMCGNGSLESI